MTLPNRNHFKEEPLFREALDAVAVQVGKTMPQVALNWLLPGPTVSSVIIGARNEEQLVQNIGAVCWMLTPEQIAMLDVASDVPAAYPVWHQRWFPMLNENISYGAAEGSGTLLTGTKRKRISRPKVPRTVPTYPAALIAVRPPPTGPALRRGAGLVPPEFRRDQSGASRAFRYGL